jgi:hypothetical protein
MMGALVVPSHLSSGTQNEFLNRLQLSDFLLDCSRTEVLVKYSVYSDSKNGDRWSVLQLSKFAELQYLSISLALAISTFPCLPQSVWNHCFSLLVCAERSIEHPQLIP